MKHMRFYSGKSRIPFILLPLVIIFVLILTSFFAVIGLVSFFVIGALALAASLFKGLKSGSKDEYKNYDKSTNTITLDKKDYDIE